MKGIDQLIDDKKGVFLDHIREMGVASGRIGTGMPEYGLNMAQAQALFKEMGGKAVSQRMNRYFFSNAALFNHGLHGLLNPTPVHGTRRLSYGFRRADGIGKKQGGMTVSFPEFP